MKLKTISTFYLNIFSSLCYPSKFSRQTEPPAMKTSVSTSQTTQWHSTFPPTIYWSTWKPTCCIICSPSTFHWVVATFPQAYVSTDVIIRGKWKQRHLLRLYRKNMKAKLKQLRHKWKDGSTCILNYVLINDLNLNWFAFMLYFCKSKMLLFFELRWFQFQFWLALKTLSHDACYETREVIASYFDRLRQRMLRSRRSFHFMLS